MARTLDPEIKQQTIIRKQLLGAMQADVLTELRKVIQGPSIEMNTRASLASSGFKVTERTMPDLYRLFLEVKNEIEFTEDVELYIVSGAMANASAYISEDPDMPHVIRINSQLYNIMNEDELKSVIGHEFGHLINQDSFVVRLFNYFYPDAEEAPEILADRMTQYNLLAEYAADRYGYIACKNLKACISSSFKINSGLNLDNCNVDFDAMLEENDKQVSFLLNHNIIEAEPTHPAETLRIIALWFFVKCKTKKDLDEKMDILFSLIPKMEKSEVEIQLARFFAAAGIKLAQADGKMDKSEKDMIIEEIAKYSLEASALLKSIQKEDIDHVIEESVSIILDQDEERTEEMLSFIVKLAFADKAITMSELEVIKTFGRNKLHMSDFQIYMIVHKEIMDNFFSLAETL